MLPVLSQLQVQTKQWMDLPLDIMGRTNVIKKIYLPKLLYIMGNSPCKIPNLFFLDTICTAFLWNGRHSRVEV